jgi:hypothetical protein
VGIFTKIGDWPTATNTHTLLTQLNPPDPDHGEGSSINEEAAVFEATNSTHGRSLGRIDGNCVCVVICIIVVIKDRDH